MLLMPTPLFDLLLSLACLYFGYGSIGRGQDLPGLGYLMTGVAAFTGFFDLGGVTEFHWVHDYLSAVARLIGTLSLGLGLMAIVWGWREQRYAGYTLAVIGPVVAYYFYVIFRGPMEGLCLWAGSIFLLSVLALAVRLWQRGRRGYAVASVLALLLTLYVGLFLHTVPQGLALKPVDILHLSLMLSYGALYYSAGAYGR